MKRIKLKLLTASVIFATTTLCLTATPEPPLPVVVQKLNEITPSKTFFQGSILPTKSDTLETHKEGKMVYVAPVGKIVYSHIKDEQGNIVKKGTPVAVQDTSYMEIEVKLADLALKKSKEALNLAQENYLRSAELRVKNIVSEKDMQSTREAYETAKIDVLNNETNLKKAKDDLENCYIYPLNTGQVQQVFCSQGQSLDKHKKVAQITVMDPIYIKLKLPIALTDHLNIQNKINIFSTGISTPVPGILTINPIDPTIVNILLVNQQIDVIPSGLDKKDLELPRVHKLRFVTHAYISENLLEQGETDKVTTELAAPVKAIHEDEKGTYVWKAAGQNGLNGSVSVKFNLEKVYVTPGDIIKDITFLFNYSGYYVSLKDHGKLNQMDIVVMDAPENAKEGETVLYTRNKWLFSTNQNVAVEIEGLNAPGFYIPESAIFNNIFGDPKVCINNNGSAKFVHVNLTGYHDGYIRITGSEIKEGTEVVINTNNDFQQLYNGAALNIKGYQHPPVKLTKDVAGKYNIVEPQTFQPKIKTPAPAVTKENIELNNLTREDQAQTLDF